MDSLQNECINEVTVTSNKPIANVATAQAAAFD